MAPKSLARAAPAAGASGAGPCAAEGPEEEDPAISLCGVQMSEVKAWLTEWSSHLEASLEDHRAALEAAEERLGLHEDRLAGRLLQLQRRRPSNGSCSTPTPGGRARPRTRAPADDGNSPTKKADLQGAAPAQEHAARQPVWTEFPPPQSQPRQTSLGEVAAAPSPHASEERPSSTAPPHDAPDAGWDDMLNRTENQVSPSHVWALLSAQGWLKSSHDVNVRNKKGSGSKVIHDLMYSTQFTSRNDKRMQAFSVGLVLVNTIYMGVQASMNLRSIQEGSSVPDAYRYLDILFVILFVLELAARLFLERAAFFTGPHYRWNVFDSLLVVTSLLDVLLFTLNLSFLRSLKAFRAVRAARMIKTITFVRELRLMVASILCSLSSLLWAFVLLTFVVYLFSIFLMQSLEVYANSIGRNPGGPLMQMYGTLLDSMYTLFCAISGGRDWVEIIRPFDEIWKGYRIIFVIYVIFVFFGVLNILTAIFVESAKHIAEIDRDIVIQDQINRDKSTINEVRRIFNAADKEGDGRLSREELEAVLLQDKTVKHLRVLELDIREVEGLFQLLDIDDHNVVVIDEFVIQLMRLKGGAKGLDLQTVLYENKRIFLRLSAMMRFMEKHMGMLETRLDIQTIEELTMKEILLDEEETHKSLFKGQRTVSSTQS